jgi:hypothetical protein
MKLLLTGLMSFNVYADIVMPTFYAHPTDRKRYGEQTYRADDIKGILWQLNYWSFSLLNETALSQSLNDVIFGKGKYSGTIELNVEDRSTTFDLYHASAGLDKKTATLFFIKQGENQRIIGIGRHVKTKINQGPKYEILVWDDRYGNISN